MMYSEFVDIVREGECYVVRLIDTCGSHTAMAYTCDRDKAYDIAEKLRWNVKGTKFYGDFDEEKCERVYRSRSDYRFGSF